MELKVGDRIRFIPKEYHDESEFDPEQTGVILKIGSDLENVVIVQLDKDQYDQDWTDDGIRETHIYQIKEKL